MAGKIDEPVFLHLRKKARGLSADPAALGEFRSIEDLHRFVDRRFYDPETLSMTEAAAGYLGDFVRDLPLPGDYGITKREAIAVEFVDKYLQMASRIIDKVDRSEVCRMIDVLKRGQEGSRPDLLSRRRRQRRQRLARRQRLPEDLRLRGLHAGGQRLRAVGADQRRRLGNRFRQLAQAEPAPLRGRDLRLFGRGRGLGQERQPEHRPGRPIRQRGQGQGPGGRRPQAAGYTALHADACVVIPPLDEESITPHTEAFQAVIWHLLVSHPDLKQNEMKWETVAKGGTNGDIS